MRTIRRMLIPLLLAALLLAGCDADIISGIQERTLPPGASESPPPVLPGGEGLAAGKIPVTLYYRYNNEAYLAPYVVDLDISNSKTFEQTLIERLIQGPDNADGDYAMLIDPNTSVVSIAEKKDHLEITLSQEYLEFLTARQSRFDADSEEYESEVKLRKQLAFYSIVNTITEMGKYSRVMLLIDRGSGMVDKLKRSEAGIDLMGSRAIDPMGRDTSYVMTVGRCAALALEALRDREWSRLGAMTAISDVDGTSAPYTNELSDIFQARPSLIEFSIIGEETFMPNSEATGWEQAVLCVDLRFRDALGNIIQYENVPLRFLRQAGIWQISYASLDAMVPAA